MSVSQLKRYLGASTPTPAVQASPAYARQAPAAPPRYVPAAAPTPKAPTYRAAAITPPPPAPVRRTQANGAKVVLYDGYAPLDPVTVTVVADIAGVQVAIDGQAMGPAPIKLSMEPGSHEVVLATAKGVAGAFTLAAGDGDAWCFSTRGSIKPVHCRKLK